MINIVYLKQNASIWVFWFARRGSVNQLHLKFRPERKPVKKIDDKQYESYFFFVHWFINCPELLGKWMRWSPTERTMTVAFSPITSPLLSLSGCCLGWSRGQGVKERPAGLWEGAHEVSRPDKQWCARAWECRGVWEWYSGWESGQVCLCTLRPSRGSSNGHRGPLWGPCAVFQCKHRRHARHPLHLRWSARRTRDWQPPR